MPTITPSIPSAGQTQYAAEVANSTGTKYLPINGSRQVGSNAAHMNAKMDRHTILHSLRVYLSTTPDLNVTLTITLLKNGTATDLAVLFTSVSSTNTWGEDLTHIAEFEPGDTACLEVKATGGGASGTIQTITMARITT